MKRKTKKTIFGDIETCFITTPDEYKFSTWLQNAIGDETTIKTTPTQLAKMWYEVEQPTKEQESEIKTMIQTINTIGVEMMTEEHCHLRNPWHWWETFYEAESGKTEITIAVDRNFTYRLIKFLTFLLAITNNETQTQ